MADTAITYSVNVNTGTQSGSVALRVDVTSLGPITEADIDAAASAFRASINSAVTVTASSKIVESVDQVTWS